MAGVNIIPMENTTQLSQENSQDNICQSQDKVVKRKSKTRSTPTPILKLTKSGSGSKPRLKRTLKRKPQFHDLSDGDMRYLWAAYKKGAFKDTIGLPDDLTVTEFDQGLKDLILTTYDHSWVVEVKIKDKYQPIGVLFAMQAGVMTILGDMVWFPWATRRARTESLINFVNEMRSKTLLVWYSNEEDKDFYVYMARHGIARRVGSIDGIYKGQAPFWQGRPK